MAKEVLYDKYTGVSEKEAEEIAKKMCEAFSDVVQGALAAHGISIGAAKLSKPKISGDTCVFEVTLPHDEAMRESFADPKIVEKYGWEPVDMIKQFNFGWHAKGFTYAGEQSEWYPRKSRKDYQGEHFLDNAIDAARSVAPEGAEIYLT